MKYGCIGESLKHSFSKEIHNILTDYDYEIREVEKDKLDLFMSNKEFTAINVTIPYKEKVMPHLYYIDEHAKLIGAVNTIVNRDGKLYGYNTDFFGLECLLKKAQIDVGGKKVAILGTGGTSKTARAVCKSNNSREIVVVSRNASENSISYQDLYDNHSDVEVIVNCTPNGMYPNNYSSPIDLDKLPKVEGVIDAIYNPLKSVLISTALERGIKALGGLYMLVAQAVRACEIFLDTSFDLEVLDKTYQTILSQKQNIVLIGMPSSGKTTIGKKLAKITNKQFIDTDVEIEQKGEKITDIFKTKGEKYFRDVESQVVLETAKKTGVIIATGGGSVLRKENVKALKQNGIIVFLDRSLENLIPTKSRPLSSDIDALKKRYQERYSVYCESCDVKVNGDLTIGQVAQSILREINL